MGPLEIEINKLTKEIEECNSEVMTLQKYWLSLQRELLKLTREQEDQLTSLDMLKKQMTIMQQKKVRTESKLFPNSFLKRLATSGGKKGRKGLQALCSPPKNALSAHICVQAVTHVARSYTVGLRARHLLLFCLLYFL